MPRRSPTWTVRPTPVRRAIRRLTVVAFLVGALVALLAGPAFAHATLESSEPAPESVLPTSPPRIALSFDEPVSTKLGGVQVYDDKGQRVDIGDPIHPDGQGTVVAVALPELRQGTYVVTYRVVSSDSHPVQGAFTFSVGKVTESATKARGIASDLLTKQGGSRVVGVAFGTARFFVFAAMAVLIGAVIAIAMVWPEGRESKRVRRLVWSAWGVLFVATLLAFALQGPYATAQGLGSALKPSVWSDVASTRYGRVALLRIGILVLVAPLVAILLPRHGAPRPVPVWWPGAVALLGLGLAATPGLAGHAATGTDSGLMLVTDALHVISMSAWVGGLVLLGVLTREPEPTKTFAEMPRWSKVATIAVLVVVFTGVARSLRELGPIGSALQTDFGRVLLIKVILVGVVLVMGAIGRDVVHRRWALPEEELALADAEAEAQAVREEVLVGAGGGDEVPAARAEPRALDEPDESGYVLREDVARHRLRVITLIEVLLMVGVLAVTAVLVNTAPGRVQSGGPFATTLDSGNLVFDIAVSPARPGENELHLSVLTQGGGPADLVDLTATLELPSRDIAPIPITMLRLGPGHYASSNLTVPFKGDWQLKLDAVTGPTDEVTPTVTVPIR